LKAVRGLPPSDPEREARQIARLRSLAIEANLDPAFAEKWFNFVVAGSSTITSRSPRRARSVRSSRELGSASPAVAGGPHDRRHRRQHG
ncbi:hypothetical protein KSI86_20980, partial [Dickeya oryzae]|uniref:chorismate mutase n=1 Tax=Dickeya oryzae TaxID=1240404 RepID=UPI002097ABD3